MGVIVNIRSVDVVFTLSMRDIFKDDLQLNLLVEVLGPY